MPSAGALSSDYQGRHAPLERPIWSALADPRRHQDRIQISGDARASGADRYSPSVSAAVGCSRAEWRLSGQGAGCGRGALGRAERLVLGPVHSNVLRILRITGRWGWRRATTWKPCRAKVDATPRNKLRVWPGTAVSTG